MKLSNPFPTFGYAGPEYFCDREKETRKILSAVANDRNVTLIAPRRYGKTGLIHNVFARLPRGTTGVYLDIFSIKDLAGFTRALANAVFGTLDSRAEKALSTLGRVFRSFRPTATPQDDGSVKFSFDIVPANAEASLKDVFAYLGERDRPIVIAIDEFQQIREFPESGVEALLRSYIQFLPGVHFIFAGSRRHLMIEMFVSPRGPFYQSTQILDLQVIPQEAYAKFAWSFFAHEGWGFSNEAFSALYGKYGGITWYVQAVLNKIWETRRPFAKWEQVVAAVDELIEERALLYHDLLIAQNAASRELLEAIAREGVVPEPTSAVFLAKYRLRGASTVRAALKDLAAKDLAYRTEHGWIVYDRLFGEWLERNC